MTTVSDRFLLRTTGRSLTLGEDFAPVFTAARKVSAGNSSKPEKADTHYRCYETTSIHTTRPQITISNVEVYLLFSLSQVFFSTLLISNLKKYDRGSQLFVPVPHFMFFSRTIASRSGKGDESPAPGFIEQNCPSGRDESIFLILRCRFF